MDARRLIRIVSAAFLLAVGTARAESQGPRNEVTPQVVFYTADSFRTMILGSLNYTFHATSKWWVSGEFFLGDAVVDSGSSLQVQDGQTFLLANLAVIYNLPVRLGMTDDAWTGDLYTSIGPCYLQFGEETPWGGFIGGGMVVHTPLHWFALRADVKNFFYVIDNPGGSDLNIDVNISLGPTFLF